MTVINKYDINEFAPEELVEIYVDKYAEAFESTKEHAREMFASEYNGNHDFHNYKNVENAINEHIRFCGM